MVFVFIINIKLRFDIDFKIVYKFIDVFMVILIEERVLFLS